MSPYLLPSNYFPPVGMREHREEIRIPRTQFKPYGGDQDAETIRRNLATNARLFGWPPTRLVLVDERGRSWVERWRALGNTAVKSTRRARRRRRGRALTR